MLGTRQHVVQSLACQVGIVPIGSALERRPVTCGPSKAEAHTPKCRVSQTCTTRFTTTVLIPGSALLSGTPLAKVGEDRTTEQGISL